MAISFPVSPEKQAQLIDRMTRLGIKESDIKETFTRSGGNGGQNINKVSTAVHLKHIPSEIEVKCSVYRTQGLNRYKARSILCDKIEEKEKPGTSRASLEREKIKKSKNKKEKRRNRKLQEMRVQELENEEEE